MSGYLSVLNCGAGDIKVTFDKDDPAEIERARIIIRDMLKRGYVLFIKDDSGKMQKVKSFDEKTNEYIVVCHGDPAGPSGGGCFESGRPKGAQHRRVHMTKGRATAIAPTAGG